MYTVPTVDESLALLHRAGWSVGDVRITSVTGVRWQVDPCNGEHFIRARDPSQAESWHLACEQAFALGLLGA